LRGKQNSKKTDSLDGLVKAAGADVLRQLVLRSAATRPDLRRQCIDFLMQNVPLAGEAKASAEAGAAFALWLELEPDLAELDTCGGGDDGTQDHVSALLCELSERLKGGDLPLEDRRALLDLVFPYIQSDNAGMDDALYDVAYAGCHDGEDLRDLAERFEAVGRDWPLEHARRIYRELGDRDKYLSLRAKEMVYGGDYYDLVTFYWEAGEREKALEVARQGMDKATGRMDELRGFMAKRALEAGNRQEYLEIEFAQAADRLTVEKHKAFKALCSTAEWALYEPRVLDALKQEDIVPRLEIHMLRREYDLAIRIISGLTCSRWDGNSIMRIAKKLEARFPEQILAFYGTDLGSLDESESRREYARKAGIVLKLRHMWIDVIRTPDKWFEFAARIKKQNLRRPAFQEEFAKVIPDWESLR